MVLRLILKSNYSTTINIYQQKMILRNYLIRVIKTFATSIFRGPTFRVISPMVSYQFSSPQNSSELINDMTQQKKRGYVQRAIIARYVIGFINKFADEIFKKKISIREALLDVDFLKDFIVKEINKHRLSSRDDKQKQDLIDNEWVNRELSQENFRQVLSAFQMDQGFKLNKIVWNQNRMSAVTNSQQLVVLNPLSIYKQYFKFLQNPDNVIISGQKGIGKSFSFVCYSYLSSFTHLIPFELEEKQRNIASKLYPMKNLENISRIIYINASHKFNVESYYKQIIPQFQGIYSQKDIYAQNVFQLNEKQEKQINLSDLQNLLGKISKKIEGKNIKLVLVIDQANKILRLVRQLLKKIKQQKCQNLMFNNKNQELFNYKQSVQYKDLKQYDKIIQIFSKRFEKIIFNSSQDYEINLFNQFSKKQMEGFFMYNFFTFDRKFLFKRVGYSNIIRLPQLQIQMHSIFWFEIQRALAQKDFTKSDLKILRNGFQEVFFKKFVKWNNDVRFLHIRQYLQDDRRRVFKSSCQELLKIKSEIKKRSQIVKYLKQLKFTIQQYRFQNLVMENSFLNFVTKADTYIKSIDRHFILLNISMEVKKILRKIQSNQTRNKKQFIYRNKDIPLQQKQLLCQTINFGYYNIQSRSIIFQLSPANLNLVFQKITFNKQYDEALKYLVNSLWLSSQNFNATFGKMLDNLSYLLFRKGQLTIQITDPVDNQKKTFVMTATVQFMALRQLSGKARRSYFQKLIQLSQQCPFIYIGGYPISKGSSFESTNQLFDNLVFRKVVDSKIQYHEIIALDWTMGSVVSKINSDITLKITRFFEKVQLKVKIKLIIYLVAPKFQVELYMKDNQSITHFIYNPISITCPDKIQHEYSFKIAYFDENLPFPIIQDKQLLFPAKMLKQIYLRNLAQHERKFSHPK